MRLMLLAAMIFLAAAAIYLRFLSGDDDPVVVSLDDSKAQTEPTQRQSEDEPSVTTQAPNDKPAIAKPDVAATIDDAPKFTPEPSQLPKRPAWVSEPQTTEQSEFGPLPKTASSGLRPLDVYSESQGTVARTRIALVVGGLGISQTGSQSAIEVLPNGITLAFSPIGNSLQRWMQKARKEGHEIALQIPLQPIGYPAVNPGRGTLIKDATVGENLDNLRWALGRVTNYPVVISYLGGGIASDDAAMEPILTEIRDRGLAWVDDGTVAASISLDIAERIKLPNAIGNIHIDADRNPGKIRSQLKGLELLAERRGYAIGTATAFPETVRELSLWVKQLDKKGIQLVPLSNLVRDYGR